MDLFLLTFVSPEANGEGLTSPGGPRYTAPTAPMQPLTT